jgi:molybdopterin converting factor subunit 1
VKINVKLFAALHELLGQRELSLELAEGATIEDLRDRLVEEHPVVATFLPTLVWALNEEYVSGGHRRLQEGDEVALIPPISGG